MYGIIYKATFPNGKVYIGQTTKDLEMRKKRHYAQMKSSIKDKKDDSVLMRAFKKYGFEKAAHFHKCGYKFNLWHDILWLEKIISNHNTPPKPFINFNDL